MIRAPATRSCSGVTPFTVARVPTGMNTGVATAPCGVSRRPTRVAPSVALTVKRMDIASLYFVALPPLTREARPRYTDSHEPALPVPEPCVRPQVHGTGPGWGGVGDVPAVRN